jgi:hypothetical protein
VTAAEAVGGEAGPAPRKLTAVEDRTDRELQGLGEAGTVSGCSGGWHGVLVEIKAAGTPEPGLTAAAGDLLTSLVAAQLFHRRGISQAPAGGPTLLAFCVCGGL